MSLPFPRAVIFDMDGTTVRHLNPFLLTCLERGDDALYRVRTWGADLSRKWGLRVPFRNPRRSVHKKQRLLVHRTLHKIRRKPVEQIVEPCPGVIDVLELFQAHKIPVGLISNGLGKGYGHDILRTFNLVHLFMAALFREDITRSKPDPESLVRMCKTLCPDINNTDTIWYIGDRAKDVKAALNAGPYISSKIIPIVYGLHGALALIENHLSNEHLVLSYEDWLDDVEQILGPLPEATSESPRVRA